jgi:hypothetical protein
VTVTPKYQSDKITLTNSAFNSTRIDMNLKEHWIGADQPKHVKQKWDAYHHHRLIRVSWRLDHFSLKLCERRTVDSTKQIERIEKSNDFEICYHKVKDFNDSIPIKSDYYSKLAVKSTKTGIWASYKPRPGQSTTSSDYVGMTGLDFNTILLELEQAHRDVDVTNPTSIAPKFPMQCYLAINYPYSAGEFVDDPSLEVTAFLNYTATVWTTWALNSKVL